MKKVIAILLIIIAVFSLTGCSGYVATSNEGEENAESMFVIVEQNFTWRVVYHKTTKVMYVVSCGGYNSGNFTVMVDQEGKPLLWEGASTNGN